MSSLSHQLRCLMACVVEISCPTCLLQGNTFGVSTQRLAQHQRLGLLHAHLKVHAAPCEKEQTDHDILKGFGMPQMIAESTGS